MYSLRNPPELRYRLWNLCFTSMFEQVDHWQDVREFSCVRISARAFSDIIGLPYMGNM